MPTPTPTPYDRRTRNRRPAATGLLLAVLSAATLAPTACGDGRPSTHGGTAPQAASRGPLTPPVSMTAQDRAAVQAQIAAGMHIDPAEIRAQLQADPNATLMTLAKPLGLAQDQLIAILLAALNDQAGTALRSGAWTAQQASQEKQFWTAQPQPDLIAEISRWFRER